MNEQLLLDSIRGVLMRLEETIIFALIERAQFAANPPVYQAGRFGAATGGESLIGYLLHETEHTHARLRRYTSPDEHPFFADLPAPILPALRFDESPLRNNRVNLNAALRRVYETAIVPFMCKAGDDAQYGSSAVCDVACLQALSRRIHYGKFVAESKYRQCAGEFQDALRAGDRAAVLRLITDPLVEERVLKRVELKARTYGQDLDGGPGQVKLDPAHVLAVYSRWIIPLTKEVEVEYLLHACRGQS
jgi:chorismate mutase